MSNDPEVFSLPSAPASPAEAQPEPGMRSPGLRMAQSGCACEGTENRPGGVSGSSAGAGGGGGRPGGTTWLAPVIPLRGQRGTVVEIQNREAGMATAEYAIATLAAVAFAALLVAVLGSGEVRELLMSLIRSALAFG